MNAWLVLAMVFCGVFFAGAALLFWIARDFVAELRTLRAGLKAAGPAPRPPVASRVPGVPPMPDFMGDHEKELEYAAYEEILGDQGRFSEAERLEAEDYFERLKR